MIHFLEHSQNDTIIETGNRLVVAMGKEWGQGEEQG